MGETKFEIKEWILSNGAKGISVAELNNGYSHIMIDDGCWVIANGSNGNAEFSAWIFPEAKKVLDKLPVSPDDYEPWLQKLSDKK